MEAELIEWLRKRLPPHPRSILGLQDDAALLAGTGVAVEESIVTADLLADGTHFELQSTSPERIGRKALGVNLSDLAAMAAVPTAAIVTLALPRSCGLALAKALYEGMLPMAEEFDVALAGGDTNVWSGPLVISVTALGTPHARGPLTRSGGKPGDRLLVTGSLGGSLRGRHLDVEPRVNEALRLHSDYTLHAGMDISDGLALDLSRLATASNCGALVELASVPISEAAVATAETDEQSALEHALGDGEDFELLLAAPPDEAARILADQPLAIPITDIGELTATPGLKQLDTTGQKGELPIRGYWHE